MNKLNIDRSIDELEVLVKSLDGLKFETLKRIYPNNDIVLIDKLKEYIHSRDKKHKEYLQILLVLNSKIEPHGHYIVVDSFGNIFDPLGVAGLINLPNCTDEVRDYLNKKSNMFIIQNINSECCGLLCLLFVFLNILLYNKKRCFINVKRFKKIVDNLRTNEPNKNVINLIYDLILSIKNN